MTAPNAIDRANLDGYIQSLASQGNGLTLDDFRLIQTLRAEKTAKRVKKYISTLSLLFLGLVLAVLFYSRHPDSNPMFLTGLWALALGGLGTCASVFLHVLKLMPQETLRSTDEFEVFGRIVLGCLFSTILTVTLAPDEMKAFFESVYKPKLESSVKLLLPFLAGYSIPLVLKLLEKAIRAVELTIGMDDPRDPTNRRGGRRGGK
jgi:energy-coupling factor transporter transmembrane protein EcfT